MFDDDIRIYLDVVPGRNPSRPLGIAGKLLILKADNWNDFGYQTFFSIAYHDGTRPYDLGAVRLLIADYDSSIDHLRDQAGLKVGEWMRTTNALFISMGSSIEYYQGLSSVLERSNRDAFLSLIHDFVYLQRREPLNPSLTLQNSDGFRKSLLRSLSQQQALKEAGTALFGDSKREDRSFSIEYSLLNRSGQQNLSFDFSPSANYPSNINVLVGINGTGKTQTLKAVIGALIEPTLLDSDDRSTLSYLQAQTNVNNAFSQIVVVSYSPFEDFPLGQEHFIAAHQEYAYYGFRRDRRQDISGDAILKEAPRLIASLIEQDDESFIEGAPERFATFIGTMQQAFYFDELATAVSTERQTTRGWHVGEPRPPADFFSRPEASLEFRKNGSKLYLSAGQTTFVALLLSVLSALRENALLLIDEPELYLHPNLELQFVRLLRKLLENYAAFAILATHSLIIAREVPKERLWVFRQNEDGEITKDRPPFQSFGADLTRIGNYIFDDALTPHPFLEWMRENLEEGQTLDSLITEDMTPELKMILRSLKQ